VNSLISRDRIDLREPAELEIAPCDGLDAPEMLADGGERALEHVAPAVATTRDERGRHEPEDVLERCRPEIGGCLALAPAWRIVSRR
jgi:hypothetical protein